MTAVCSLCSLCSVHVEPVATPVAAILLSFLEMLLSTGHWLDKGPLLSLDK